MSQILLDCTFRDGGYYNAWDFPQDVIHDYLAAMKAAEVNIVEMGFRFLANNGFKGACAYTTDDFLRSLDIPKELTVAVMVNGGDLLTDFGFEAALEALFPEAAHSTPVDVVRFACHFHEFERVLPAVPWLTERGYRVGFNLMQIADRNREEVLELARKAREYPVEVLYFADSMGSMSPEDAARIVGWLREEWNGPIGIHTHDNMGLALQNTLKAQDAGATWMDATVTGMGRGPGNARTEELVIETASQQGKTPNLVPLMGLIRRYFQPMKNKHGWGSNPYYYLSGKYGIHPTYIQEMLGDARYSEEDILSVIDFLHQSGGKKFNSNILNSARSFYGDNPSGTWAPKDLLKDKKVLILGTGPGVAQHRLALEDFIRREKPVVIALNTQSEISADLIDLRTACHPTRLTADCDAHANLPHPLITPASMLPDQVRTALGDKTLLDFGLGVEMETFQFGETRCVLPRLLVLAYTLAIAASGHAAEIYLAGFDGYPPGDPRNTETADIFQAFDKMSSVKPISITPTRHKIPSISVYGMRQNG